jgi:hypothetical protein
VVSFEGYSCIFPKKVIKARTVSKWEVDDWSL